MNHLDIEECHGVGLNVLHESPDEVLRLSAACTYEESPASMNVTEDILFRGELLGKSLSQLG